MALLEESHTEQDGPRSHLGDVGLKHILFTSARFQELVTLHPLVLVLQLVVWFTGSERLKLRR